MLQVNPAKMLQFGWCNCMHQSGQHAFSDAPKWKTSHSVDRGPSGISPEIRSDPPLISTESKIFARWQSAKGIWSLFRSSWLESAYVCLKGRVVGARYRRTGSECACTYVCLYLLINVVMVILILLRYVLIACQSIVTLHRFLSKTRYFNNDPLFLHKLRVSNSGTNNVFFTFL